MLDADADFRRIAPLNDAWFLWRQNFTILICQIVNRLPIFLSQLNYGPDGYILPCTDFEVTDNEMVVCLSDPFWLYSNLPSDGQQYTIQ